MALLRSVAGIGTVDAELIHRLDRGRCHICGKRVSLKATVRARMAVLDHVIPRNVWLRPGTVTGDVDRFGNLRIAHFACNSRRSGGKTPGQPRLF